MATKKLSLLCVMAAVALNLAFAVLASATTIEYMSFDYRPYNNGGASTPMGAAETAGVISLANWNDVVATNDQITASVAAGSVKNSAGTVVTGVSLTSNRTYGGTGGWGSAAAGGTSGTNDVHMMSSVFDIFNTTSGNVDGVSDLTTTISGLGKYSSYDLYVIAEQPTNSARGGNVWINGNTATNKSMRGGLADYPYVESSYTGTFSPTLTTQGNYVKFTGLTGNTLTIDYDVQVRFRQAGIQIVGTVPEPSTIVLLGMGLLGLLAYAWRKRKS